MLVFYLDKTLFECSYTLQSHAINTEPECYKGS